MITKKCLNCGKEFQVQNYRKDTAKFCCKSCASKYNYETILKNIDQSYKKGNQFRKGLKPSNSFPKGHIPWNKGLKGIHLSPNSEFKKGRTNKSNLEVGSITKRTDKNGKARNYIKIAEPNVWKELYVYVWEQEHGKLPKGCVLHHINKISDDDRLENIVCLTRAEHINIHRKYLLNKGE